MFTFEDLVRLEAPRRPCCTTWTRRSWRGAQGRQRGEQFFFANMSPRAGKMLKDDMDAMGPVRLKDVDEAQGRMVTVAKDLAARGEIMITKTSGDEEMVPDDRAASKIPLRPRLRAGASQAIVRCCRRARAASTREAESKGYSEACRRRSGARRRGRTPHRHGSSRSATALDRTRSDLDAIEARLEAEAVDLAAASPASSRRI